jgi:superfamily II DNA/RNA helicase
MKESTHRVVELHSQMPQKNRESAVESFRAGKCPLLLATDICARGLHVPNVRFVVHYDFPGNLQDYVHRCGRAGRGATTPVHVYSFFTRPMAALAPDLVKLLESTGQWIDPNLTDLVEDASRRATKRKEQARKRNNLQAGNNKEAKDKKKRQKKQMQDDLDDDPFAELAGNRIVLKRAAHVSDASSSEDEEEDS